MGLQHCLVAFGTTLESLYKNKGKPKCEPKAVVAFAGPLPDLAYLI